MNPITHFSKSAPFHSHAIQNHELNTSFLKSSLTNCDLETVSQNSQEPSCITRFFQSILQFFRSLFCLDRCVKTEENNENESSIETSASEEVEPSFQSEEEKLNAQRMTSFQTDVVEFLANLIVMNDQRYMKDKSMWRGELKFAVRTIDNKPLGYAGTMYIYADESFQLHSERFVFLNTNLPETLLIVYEFRHNDSFSNRPVFFKWIANKYMFHPISGSGS